MTREQQPVPILIDYDYTSIQFLTLLDERKNYCPPDEQADYDGFVKYWNELVSDHPNLTVRIHEGGRFTTLGYQTLPDGETQVPYAIL